MSLFGKSEHVHHHSLLAGAGAGAVAVLAAFGLVLIDWHRAAGPVTVAITAFACCVVAAAAIAAIGALVYAAIWLRHKHRQFSAAAPALAPALQAQVLSSGPVPALEAAPVLQPLPASHTHVHLPDGMAPEAVAVALRALAPQLPAGPPVEAVLPEIER